MRYQTDELDDQSLACLALDRALDEFDARGWMQGDVTNYEGNVCGNGAIMCALDSLLTLRTKPLICQGGVFDLPMMASDEQAWRVFLGIQEASVQMTAGFQIPEYNDDQAESVDDMKDLFIHLQKHILTEGLPGID